MSRITDAHIGVTPRSAVDPRDRSRGTSVAIYAWALLVTAVMLPGCLITQPVHFDQPANSPPAISDGPASVSPTSQIVDLVGGSTTGPDAGIPQLTLDTLIYDPDVDQRLEWRVYIDTDTAASLQSALDPLPSTASSRDHRPLAIPLTTARFETTNPSCHRVRLFVSGSFGGAMGPVPVVAGDIASATWWIAYQPMTGGTVDMSLCPRQ